MRILVKTTDPLLVSRITSLCKDAGFDTLVFDTHASILDGSIGILPRRIMVADDDYDAARRLLHEADLAAELAE